MTGPVPNPTPPSSTAWPPLRIAQWAVVVSLLVASEAVNLLGHGALSWAIDGVVLVAFVAFTPARRARPARAHL